ncbi:flagellin N-terminal helical domain-containing protein [Leclercia sp. LSNIH1]|uniref:flagellin N-terminal helical domain-containing protein n=1 Tax=Leclercia sp. LSNIH1 TaxID=1920114 RepID=UPI000CD0846F|nr:flagellin [Leclercia sp. LSNIH1]AUU85601.1 flagellin [Leclercia sp. LSNIH1]POV35894.1 flagellin [Leclercia sp. LSNIH5]POW65215.1 flagellin [Leclercia sp. LSNIH2]
MLAINHNEIAGLSLKSRKANTTMLSQTIERLSSGLRINSAKDDAAGQAIANRMFSNINADSVISRGLDDAISLAQTAEGSLSDIGNMLIKAKSLAIQAANGTLSPSDRESINQEYQQILATITQVSEQTEIFGQYPLATDKPVLPPQLIGDVPPLNNKFPLAGTDYSFSSGIIPLAYIPAGSTNITITIDSLGLDDDLQLFTRDGKHLAGTPLSGPDADYTWVSRGITDGTKATASVLTAKNGFSSGAVYDDSQLIEGGPSWSLSGESLNYNGMTITYSGDGDRYEDKAIGAWNDGANGSNRIERMTLDTVSEDLLVMVVGSGSFTSNITWGTLPTPTMTPAVPPKQSRPIEVVTSANFGEQMQTTTIEPTPTDLKTLQLENSDMASEAGARKCMGLLDAALEKVSSYRGQYGAMMNRFESSKAVLSQQGVAMQAARSRIQDADYAAEASQLARAQILAQSQNAALKMANQAPQTVLELLKM